MLARSSSTRDPLRPDEAPTPPSRTSRPASAQQTRSSARSRLGFELLGEKRGAGQVLELHGHDLRGTIDVDLAEELQAGGRREVGLTRGRVLLEDHLRPKGVV